MSCWSTIQAQAPIVGASRGRRLELQFELVPQAIPLCTGTRNLDRVAGDAASRCRGNQRELIDVVELTRQAVSGLISLCEDHTVGGGGWDQYGEFRRENHQVFWIGRGRSNHTRCGVLYAIQTSSPLFPAHGPAREPDHVRVHIRRIEVGTLENRHVLIARELDAPGIVGVIRVLSGPESDGVRVQGDARVGGLHALRPTQLQFVTRLVEPIRWQDATEELRTSEVYIARDDFRHLRQCEGVLTDTSRTEEHRTFIAHAGRPFGIRERIAQGFCNERRPIEAHVIQGAVFIGHCRAVGSKGAGVGNRSPVGPIAEAILYHHRTKARRIVMVTFDSGLGVQHPVGEVVLRDVDLHVQFGRLLDTTVDHAIEVGGPILQRLGELYIRTGRFEVEVDRECINDVIITEGLHDERDRTVLEGWVVDTGMGEDDRHVIRAA